MRNLDEVINKKMCGENERVRGREEEDKCRILGKGLKVEKGKEEEFGD
jgi:hypothetical protein